MALILEHYEKYLATLERAYPETRAKLNAPASPQMIDNAERAMQCKLPESIKLLYRLHNGQSGGWLDLLGDRWLSLSEVVETWSHQHRHFEEGYWKGLHSEPDEGIRNDIWNPNWIPITNMDGDLHCIDLSPTETGVPGQIIEWIHDSYRRPLVAKSAEEWLVLLIADAEEKAEDELARKEEQQQEKSSKAFSPLETKIATPWWRQVLGLK